MLRQQMVVAANTTSATYVVNQTFDAVDANTVDGICDVDINTPGGQCTLRAAIQQANAHAGPDTVVLTGNLTYALSITGTLEDDAIRGDLDINDDLLISIGSVAPSLSGLAAVTSISNQVKGRAVLDGQQIDRVLHIVRGQTEISGVVIYNGNVGDAGGGLLDEDKLIMTNSLVMSSSADTGGGIYVYGGRLQLKDTDVLSNRAQSLGGGLYNDPGSTIEMNGGRIAYNAIESAAGYGAGLANTNIAGLYQVVVSDNWISSTQIAIGGGLLNFNSGTLSLELSRVERNWITGTLPNSGNGGGLHNASNSHMIIISTTLAENQSIYGGGLQNDGLMTITASSIYSNAAIEIAGGIANIGADDPAAQLMIVNSTIGANRSQGSAGGIHNDGRMSIFNATVANNVADADQDGRGDVGGLSTGTRLSGTVETFVANSVIALNIDASPVLTSFVIAPDCGGMLIAQGINLVQNTTGCKLTGTLGRVITNTNPRLGPLQDNSGPTWSYQPMFASPLINSGAMDGCRDANNTVLNVDQRGLQRPRDGRCDLGALETDNLVTAVLYMPTLWR